MNDTKIRFTVICGRLYEISAINFSSMELVAVTCKKDIQEISEEELFPFDELREFKMRIEN